MHKENQKKIEKRREDTTARQKPNSVILPQSSQVISGFARIPINPITLPLVPPIMMPNILQKFSGNMPNDDRKVVKCRAVHFKFNPYKLYLSLLKKPSSQESKREPKLLRIYEELYVTTAVLCHVLHPGRKSLKDPVYRTNGIVLASQSKEMVQTVSKPMLEKVDSFLLEKGIVSTSQPLPKKRDVRELIAELDLRQIQLTKEYHRLK